VKMDSEIQAPPADSTIVELVRNRAIHAPSRVAYTFLSDTEQQRTTLTYQRVDERARAIGSWLTSIGMAGERALLLYPPGLEFVTAFFGSLYGGVTAVPAYPLSHLRARITLSRLQSIVHDAKPAIALTSEAYLPQIDRLLSDYPALKALRWIATETITDYAARGWKRPQINDKTLALIQYTSGSTSTPKGVMVSHRNILTIEEMIQSSYGYSDHTTFVGWVPLAHDWGLIYFVLQVMYAGAQSVFIAPETFVTKPSRWLREISRHEEVMSSGPNFSFELCIKKITPEERLGFDLKSWRWALIGAEPTRPNTLREFVNIFGQCGFRAEAFHSAYGLAEATLTVSVSPTSCGPRILRVSGTALEENRVVVDPCDDSVVREIVSCGRVLSGEKAVIVNPDTREACLLDHSGEIWVSGPNVAHGYWNNPVETERTFHGFVNGTRDGPYLRTGDLGFIYEDNLYVTGRLKDMIIIRGRNLYPHDIELSVARCHEMLRPGCTAAFSIEVGDEERLVVVQELRDCQECVVPEVVKAIRQSVSREHDVGLYAAVLIRASTIPKTSSGKIRRTECRAAYLSCSLDVIHATILEGL
jgi:acyl-CoA synthetase (AMP-forming)/AMP-acid ligase II